MDTKHEALLELNSNDFIATPPETRMTAGVVSVAHPPLDYWNNLYYDLAEVSDDVLDGMVAHEDAICSMLEYLRSHQPDSVELDVRTKQVELYGFK